MNNSEKTYWNNKEEFDWMPIEDIQKVLSKIPYPKGECLELCCGSGMFTRYMNFSANDSYIAIDISKKMTEKIRKEMKYIKVECGDVKYELLENTKYDNIYIFAGLHHLENEEQVINQITQKLKPNGSYICFEPNAKCIYRPIMLKLKDYLRIYTKDERFLDPDKIVKICKANGLDTKIKYTTPNYKSSHVGLAYPLSLIMQLISKIKSKRTQSWFTIVATKREVDLDIEVLSKGINNYQRVH